MPGNRRILLLFLFQIFLGVSAESVFPPEGGLKGYEYLSPLPFSLCHNPESVIIIRFGEEIDISSLQNELLDVTGSISGKHPGKFTISQDHLTLNYTPDLVFSCNEKVFLHLREGIKTQSGRLMPAFEYWFTTRPNSVLYSGSPEIIITPEGLPEKSGSIKAAKGAPLSYIDFNFPEITLSDQPTKGNILTTLLENSSNYLYVFDNNG